ncbi:lipase member M-like isoform X3 [Rhineura floridana]|uniref:lipase member M-like isoform X3 n=1 Tax=Rhineura floridana TaxID=261503 RepID=UPI002AC7F99E|nr:lipase member M-like isoform X3 [Rhineura floridana]
MWLFLAVVCIIQQTTETEEFLRKRHLNPQESMTPNEIIQYWRYPSEEHEILTDDGYYLLVNRIPYGIHSPGKTGSRSVVLLVHGILLESRCWIANLPNNSIGFVLADAGYDVWMINTRGTTWSRRHRNLSIDQEEFWDFSFHEIAIYDIPATINFILQKTKQEKLYFIGHSQGGTSGFIAFSVLPHLAKKIKLVMTFAPVYTLVGVNGPVLTFLILPEGLITSRADVYFGIFPDFTSVKDAIHWVQVFQSKELKYFDYGSKNKAVYNMTTPPFYNIEDMVVPTALWNAGNDKMVDKKDIELLLPRITNLVFHKYIPDWQHSDFMWGIDAPTCLFPDVLYLMQKYK